MLHASRRALAPRVRQTFVAPLVAAVLLLPFAAGAQSARAKGPAPAPVAARGAAPTPGKYSCIESIFRVTRGVFEFEPRGSFVLEGSGRYRFLGLDGTGSWRWDAAAGALTFKGARLDGGRATLIDGGPRLRIELPTNDPKRPLKWTCSPSDGR